MQPGNIFDYTYTGNAVEGSYAKEVVRIKICGSQAMKRISWFYLKWRARGGASKEWEEWTVSATAPSLCPSQVPSPVSGKNCKTPKALASRLYRLLSGHAMTGPFLKKKRGESTPGVLVRNQGRAKPRTPQERIYGVVEKVNGQTQKWFWLGGGEEGKA